MMEDNNFLIGLIKEKEGEQLAFFAQFESAKIAETVCAFLNTNGGRVIVGVDSKKDLSSIDSFESKYLELTRFIYSSISPESLIGIRKEAYQGKHIILIEIIEGNKKPYTVDNRAFVRKGIRTSVADDNDMSLLIRSRRTEEYSWERSPVLEATLEDLDLAEIDRTIERANNMERSSKFKVGEPLQFLSHFQLFKNSQLTNAAIVLFGKDPTYFLPQCRIRIIEFPFGKTGDRFENTELIETNLFKSYDTIQKYFRHRTPFISEFTDNEWRRSDRLKYPVKALDEAVINALMHRDYSDSAGEVFIGIYHDKIEIINSGQLPKALNDKKLKTGHKSMPPNPAITHIVYLCGLIEKVGRGTLLIVEEFEKLGLQEPIWVSKEGDTKLILNSTPKSIEFNDRINKFINSLKHNQEFTSKAYEEFFKNEKISERTVRNDIAKLLEAGLINRSGATTSVKYTKI